MNTRLALVALVALVASVSLTGCGGDPSLAPAPSSSTPTPTASPTPTPPPLPAAATKRTPAGAKAFLRHFFKAMVFAGDTGDTSYFRTLFNERCVGCAGIADGIDGAYAKGGYFRGGEWIPVKMATYGFDGDRFPVDVTLTTKPQKYVRQKGGRVHVSKPEPAETHFFELTWAGKTWHVSGLDERQ